MKADLHLPAWVSPMTAKRLRAQPDLPVGGGSEVFNLAGEATADGERLAREAIAREAAAIQARLYQERMQRTFEGCPGFIGADAPSSEASEGRVTVEPARVTEAVAWLKRRFHVRDELGLAGVDGLCLHIKPRARGPVRPGQKRAKVTFAKTEQFTLNLD